VDDPDGHSPSSIPVPFPCPVRITNSSLSPSTIPASPPLLLPRPLFLLPRHPIPHLTYGSPNKRLRAARDRLPWSIYTRLPHTRGFCQLPRRRQRNIAGGFCRPRKPAPSGDPIPPLRFRVTERCGPLRQGGSMCAKRASTGFRRVVILLTYSCGTSRTHSNKNACELDSFSAVTKHALAPFSTHTIVFVLSSLLVSSLCLL